MEFLFQDIRYGIRLLFKRPLFTTLAVLTLALGIGANTAIFSVVNTVLLKPLPYKEPERLVVLNERQPGINLNQQPVSVPNFTDWKEQSQLFEQMAMMRTVAANILVAGEPEQVNGLRVSAELFQLLGIKPDLGRDFLESEGRPGGEAVVIISHGLWQRRYGSDASIIGRSINIDSKSYTIIGVLPRGVKHPGIRYPDAGADIWMPLIPLQSELVRGFKGCRAIARLKPGISIKEADTELNLIAERLEQQYPDFNTGWRTEVIALDEQVVGRVRTALWILLGAVASVLAIACVNVANLLLAQASARRMELAIRTAFGASRWRLVQQMLTENALLSIIGGALGLPLAIWGVPLLVGIDANRIPRFEEISIDQKVLVFTIAISLSTSLIFGLFPALKFSSNRFTETLKEGRRGSGAAAQNRILNFLVVAEISIALVLLVGAGLMIRSFLSVREVSPGFNPQGLLTMGVSLPQSKYKDQQQQIIFYRNIAEKIENLPGVQSVAGVSRLPIVGFSTLNFTVKGQPVSQGNEPSADYRAVSVEYFQAMNIPVMSGRNFSEQDTEQSSDSIIINQAMRERFFPEENPIGKQIQLAAERTRWREIVGVVGDAKLSALDAVTQPAIYVPFSQNTWPNALRNGYLVVRTGVEPESIVSAIRSELNSIDRDMPLSQVRTMDEIISNSLSQRRFNTSLLVVFAALAGALACLGIYGVMSFNVTQRTHEIGVRMALGAQKLDVLGMILGQGARITATGIAIGITGAFALTRVLSSLLFGISATDVATFVSISLLLAIVAIVACWIPARRATRVDPMVALRQD
jgi:putative ABC transport system permease protein